MIALQSALSKKTNIHHAGRFGDTGMRGCVGALAGSWYVAPGIVPREIFQNRFSVLELTQHFSLLLLSLAGLAITSRFIFVLRTEKKCGEPGYCSLVMQTPQGKTFGIKNTSVGILFYSGIFFLQAMQLLQPQSIISLALISEIFIFCSAIVSGYLFYQLVAVLRMRCPLCIAAHVVNFAMVAVWVIL